MDYKAMGARIKKLRKDQGLTQEKLAELVDISLGFLSTIEAGTKPGGFDTYVRIANALNTTLDYLSQDIITKSGENHDHQELIKYFDSLSYKQQRYVLDFIKKFCDFTNAND